MTVNDPANAYLKNIYVDTDNLVSGFVFIPNWNYPEAYLTPVLDMENITFYASEGTAETRPKCLDYKGPANITINNVDLTSAYNLASTGDSHFVINISPTWAPNDGLFRNIGIHETKLSLENNTDASKTNVIVIQIGVSTDRRLVFNFTDSYAENFHGGIYGSIAAVGSFSEEMYYSNIHHNNYSGSWNMGYFLGISKFFILLLPIRMISCFLYKLTI